MILAGIDIGTNTLRLLIAETGPDAYRLILSDRRTTRLGENLDRSGQLSQEAQERSLAALSDFAASIRRCSAAAWSAVGTSALRIARNTGLFLAETRQRTGIDVRVISGEEEARLTLLGVLQALRGRIPPGFSGGDTMVIDVGGGSTEIMTTKPAAEVSVPLGAVYLTDRFIRHDPPLPDELDALRSSVRKVLAADCPATGHPVSLLGTAGTITTLAAMELRLPGYDPERINGFILTREAVDRTVVQLSRMPLEERRGIPGLETGREDIILAGAIVVQEIMERFGTRCMLVSDGGLREGILLDLYDRVKQETGRAGRAGS